MTKKTTLRAKFSPADHLPIALLSLMDGWEKIDQERMPHYLEGARAIVRSPHAFDQGIDTLSVADHVLHSDLGTDGTHDRGKAFNKALAVILKGDEGEDVTADAYELLMLLYRVINESTLYGAACMYELLEGRAR